MRATILAAYVNQLDSESQGTAYGLEMTAIRVWILTGDGGLLPENWSVWYESL